MNITQYPASPAEDALISTRLSQDGAGVTFNANGDYSGAAVYWEIRPGSGNRQRIRRLLWTTEDAGTFDTGDYGNSITLTNGITLEHVRGTGASPTVLATLTPDPIITNADISRYCYDVRVDSYGTGNQFLAARWTLAKMRDDGIILDGNQDDALRFTLNDSFVGLVYHGWLAQGCEV